MVFARALLGQEVVNRAAECGQCTIERHTVAVLGRDQGGQLAAPLGVVGITAGHDQTLIGVVLGGRGTPLVFTANGRFVRTIGRAGRGPGEYIAPRDILRWRGDSILVADPSIGRFSVLSPSYQYVRSLPFTLPSFESVTALPGGELVVNVYLSDKAVVGFPLHVIDPDGKRLRSFGSERPVVSPGTVHEMARFITSSDGVVWSATPFGDYTIEGWDVETGTLKQRIRRIADFYREGPRQAPTPKDPPSPAIAGIFAEGRYLWVFVAVPANRWHRGLARNPVRGEGGGAVYRVENANLVYDTVVEVFDTKTGKLHASARFDEFMSAPLGASPFGLWRVETDAGIVETTVARFAIVGSSSRRSGGRAFPMNK